MLQTKKLFTYKILSGKMNKKEQRGKMNMRKERGITIISLIITIVILLILVAVVVDVTVDGKLVDSAKQSVDKTNEKVEQHQNRIDGLMGELDKVLQGTGGAGDEGGNQDGWETIFTGNAKITDGSVALGENVSFSPLYEYRITGSGGGYSETISVPRLLAMPNGGQYLLFGIGIEKGKNQIQSYTFNTITEAETKISELDFGFAFLGVNDSTDGGKISIMELVGKNTTEFTITKIERKEKNATEVWQENVTVSNGVALIELESTVDLTKDYEIFSNTYGYASFAGILAPEIDMFAEYTLVYSFGESTAIFVEQSGSIYMLNLDASISSLDISILDVGIGTPLYAEENEFKAIFYNGKWTLTDTPNDTYVVPETVNGKRIEAVGIFHLGGIPIFERAVEIVSLGWWYPGETICVNVLDYDFIIALWNVNNEYGYDCPNLDLSGCGDSLEIPEEILNGLSSYDVTIYVTSAVKQKYQTYEKIVVKQD